MKLAVEVEIGNDAMQTASDASHAIQKALADGGGHSALFEKLAAGEGGKIMDNNGNTVGQWEVTE